MVFLRILGLFLTVAAGLQVQPATKTATKTAPTLKEWMSKNECLSLSLVPQYNNQHSIWGLLEFMRKNALLTHLTGISACSGGSLPGAFIAAGKQYKDFDAVFPKSGWVGFGPSEPKISDDYTNFLSAALPATFEELKIPFALSATSWDNEDALKAFTKSASKEVVLNSGSLYPAMMTAVATGNSGVIPDKSCPRCKVGFWPKQVGLMQTVTDGAFTDIWGTKGLIGLPKCHRLLHVLPLDYPGQTAPQKPEEIPTKPTELVTMVVTQPPTASHSYFSEGAKQDLEKNPLMKFNPGLKNALLITTKSSAEWNDLMYQNAAKALAKVVDEPMQLSSDTRIGKHYTVLVDNAKVLRKVESGKEKVYDALMDTMRDNFWKFWGSQDGFEDSNGTDTKSKGNNVKMPSPLSGLMARELGPPVELMAKQ